MTISLTPSLPVMDSKSEAPPLFDGTTRLYINTTCPFAQRVWIARNFKGLENVQLVPISLQDKPTWYLEKVYPPGKVPSLEHNGKVVGESLDLLEYFEKNFEGPSMFPGGSAKEAAKSDLLKHSDELNKQSFTILRNKEATGTMVTESLDPVFDYLEAALSKFSDEGPYFLGTVSAVDFVYAPFFERFLLLLPDCSKYYPLKGRPKLAEWVQAMDTVDAYASTKVDSQVLLSALKKYLGR